MILCLLVGHLEKVTHTYTHTHTVCVWERDPSYVHQPENPLLFPLFAGLRVRCLFRVLLFVFGFLDTIRREREKKSNKMGCKEGSAEW